MRRQIALWILVLSGCATHEPQTSRPKTSTATPTFALAEAIYVVHQRPKTEEYFETELKLSSQPIDLYSSSVQSSAVSFPDRSRLILANSDHNDDAFARLISDSLTEREGVAFVGIKTNRLDFVEGVLRRREIPFAIIEATEQRGRTLFFPDFPRLRLFYFFQDRGDGPVQMQANSAQGLNEAWVAVDDFYALEADFSALGFPDAESTVFQPFRSMAKSLKLASGTLHFVNRDNLNTLERQYLRADSNTILGLSIRMESIEATAKKIQARNKIKFATTRYNNKSCILIPPKYGAGSWFEMARPLSP